MYKLSRRNFVKSSTVLGVGLGLGVAGCGGGGSAGGEQSSARFAVLSDPHIYDTSLGKSGAAFEDYLSNDRKMLVESVEILEAMVQDFIDTDSLDFVLIPGDLTKDGERVCHEKLVSILQPLLDKSIEVFVVPGNHDINNPDAVQFDGDVTTPVDTVTPEEFAEIYEDFGYGSALYRDSNSLSYVAQVADGTWLFAIDSCKYDNNDSHPETSGAISDETLSWIQGRLAEAKSKGKTVFAMLHHGMVPHFQAQTQFFAEYVLDDYASVGETLADEGLNVFFTGHFHAQDIVRANFTNSYIYDIETGSGVTAPSPYRIIDLDIENKVFNIKSYEVESIPSNDTFYTYKTTFVATGMLELYTKLLPGQGIDVSLAPVASEIHVAHYRGEEQGHTNLSAASAATVSAMLVSSDPSTQQLGYALADFAADDGVADNDIEITFK